MAVRACNTQALCGDDRSGRRLDVVALDVAPDLHRLLLALLFLAADVRNNVVYHLGPGLKGLAGTGDRLIGADGNLGRLKVHQSGQRRNVGLDRAVGLNGDKAALGSQTLALCRNDLGMVSVDLRNDHRNVRGTAVSGVVGANRALELCVLLLKGADLILLHIYRAEDEINLGGNLLCISSCVVHNHVLVLVGHRNGHLPAALASLGIGLALVSAGCSECYDVEPRVVFQQQGEALTDHTGRADDAYFVLLHVYQILPKGILTKKLCDEKHTERIFRGDFG